MIRIEGFILAGGAGKRMGRSKANLSLGGKSFVERAVDALTDVTGGNLSIVGDSEVIDTNSLRNVRIIPDLVTETGGSRGAILGLRTAFFTATERWLAILACDLPFVSPELFGRLSTMAKSDFDAVVPVQPDGQMQPLCALYRRATCLPAVERAFATGNWSLKQLLDSVNTRRVQFPEIADLLESGRFFLNVNTPADYRRARFVELRRKES